MNIDFNNLWEQCKKTAPLGEMPRCFGEAVLAASRAGVDCDTKALRDALDAGPTDGPWSAAGPSFGDPLPRYCNEVIVDREGRDEDGETVCRPPIQMDTESTVDMVYIAAANPATIRALLAERDSLLARLDAAESALNDAATSLETISRLAGKESYADGIPTFMGTFSDVRGYAISRAQVARAALTQGA